MAPTLCACLLPAALGSSSKLGLCVSCCCCQHCCRRRQQPPPQVLFVPHCQSGCPFVPRAHHKHRVRASARLTPVPSPPGSHSDSRRRRVSNSGHSRSRHQWLFNRSLLFCDHQHTHHTPSHTVCLRVRHHPIELDSCRSVCPFVAQLPSQ